MQAIGTRVMRPANVTLLLDGGTLKKQFGTMRQLNDAGAYIRLLELRKQVWLEHVT